MAISMSKKEDYINIIKEKMISPVLKLILNIIAAYFFVISGYEIFAFFIVLSGFGEYVLFKRVEEIISS